MRAFNFLFIVAGIVAMNLSSCKEGDMGPVGPQGEQGVQGDKGDKGDKGNKGDKGATGARGATGATGPAGPRGATGPKGSTGTANVIYSGWLSFDLKSGVYAGLYYAELAVPKLTQAVLNGGDVRLYISGGATAWSIPNATMSGFYYRFEVGKIRLYSPTDWDTASGYHIRYVLIPGGVSATMGNIDLQDYNAVKAAFHIVD